MNKFYAGVGSRNAPISILILMTRIATKLEKNGFILRSGGAEGSDQAFESGVLQNENKEIFLVGDEVPGEAYRIAKKIHPAWDRMGNYGKSAHARNCCQILGKKLDKPVEFVICWTKNGRKIGGTRTAIVLAEELSIPVYNLANRAELNYVVSGLISNK